VVSFEPPEYTANSDAFVTLGVLDMMRMQGLGTEPESTKPVFLGSTAWCKKLLRSKPCLSTPQSL
jgi:hypothetical protein